MVKTMVSWKMISYLGHLLIGFEVSLIRQGKWDTAMARRCRQALVSSAEMGRWNGKNTGKTYGKSGKNPENQEKKVKNIGKSMKFACKWRFLAGKSSLNGGHSQDLMGYTRRGHKYDTGSCCRIRPFSVPNECPGRAQNLICRNGSNKPERYMQKHRQKQRQRNAIRGRGIEIIHHPPPCPSKSMLFFVEWRLAGIEI